MCLAKNETNWMDKLKGGNLYDDISRVLRCGLQGFEALPPKPDERVDSRVGSVCPEEAWMDDVGRGHPAQIAVTVEIESVKRGQETFCTPARA